VFKKKIKRRPVELIDLGKKVEKGFWENLFDMETFDPIYEEENLI